MSDEVSSVVGITEIMTRDMHISVSAEGRRKPFTMGSLHSSRAVYVFR
jgi:hypothetical protein